MTNANLLSNLTEKCDIYFEGSLISKESIIKKYADFFASAVSGDERSVSISLHTGSVCFNIVTFITAALGCLSLDMTTPEQIIESLTIGDIVLYKNKRYRWLGLSDNSGKDYLTLEQDAQGRNGKTKLLVPVENGKTLVKPYNGESELTDGRGIRKANSNRIDFLSSVLELDPFDIPSVSGVSTVIVADRMAFYRICKGLKIYYDEGRKQIGLLDVVTASYFADSGNEYSYGNNPGRIEPVLKIAGKISTARDLVLNKHGNKAVGFVVVDSDAIAKGYSELTDLLERKSLHFAHVSTNIDSEAAEVLLETQDDATIFACTKEFLLQTALPPNEVNPITLELDRQISNIVNNEVITIPVEGGCSWGDLKKAKGLLYRIRKSDWNEAQRDDFIISAHALLNMLTTAVFTMGTLEETVADRKLRVGVISPAERIRELWNIAEKAGSLLYECAEVAETIESLYKSQLSSCPKYDALKKHLDDIPERKVAVIVPKPYYVDILEADGAINRENITILSASRFGGNPEYDEIIAVGEFSSKRFDALKCRAAENITVLLYDSETHTFMHRKKKAGNFEKRLNTKLGVSENDAFDDAIDIEPEGIDAFENESADLEQYIENINLFDIKSFAARVSGSARNTPTSEVYAIGRFASGEQILFTKYYNAVVFNESEGKVNETAPENLNAGDLLVFSKRDDYTKNMVDFIYEKLQTQKRMNADVLAATEKAFYWKEALREYKQKQNLSYHDLADRLKKLGCTLQEVAIRQWIIPESHIVGPRDEATLQLVAELTQDPYLLGDVHGHFEACRIVRHQRKTILKLIGKAIADKLSGQEIPDDEMLGVIYNDIENLSDVLELENVTLLDEPISIPINIINKPITEAEVSI